MSRTESGSVHVAIIAVLAVMLIGAVGVLFWQNVLQKPKTTGTNTTASMSPSPSVAAKPSLKTYCAPAEKLCFEYPGDWKIAAKTNENPEIAASLEEVIISDEKDQPWLRLQTGMTGLGGACGNDDNSYTKIMSTHTTAIKGAYLVNEGTSQWFDSTAYAVSWATYHTTGKNWTINMELNTAKAVQTIAKIDPCDVGLGVLKGKNAKLKGMDSIGAVSFGYYTGKDSDETYSTEAKASAALASDGATKAYAILQSAHYE